MIPNRIMAYRDTVDEMPQMNPQELSAYFTNLLQSGPEVIVSFLMGVFFTGMLVFALRRWIVPARDSADELARKDADIARKDAEVARKEAQIARAEARLAIMEGTLVEKDALVRTLRQENATLAASSASNPSLPPDYATAPARNAQLEAENRQLVQVKQSLEKTIDNQRTELAQVSGELAHAAKWLKAYEEELARLAESGLLTKD